MLRVPDLQSKTFVIEDDLNRSCHGMIVVLTSRAMKMRLCSRKGASSDDHDCVACLAKHSL